MTDLAGTSESFIDPLPQPTGVFSSRWQGALQCS